MAAFKMKKRLVIWIIGGSGVGKTTQASYLHNFFHYSLTNKPINPEIISWKEDNEKGEPKKLCYTLMNPLSANLGPFGSTACSGTDSLGSKFQIRRSFEEAYKRRQVVMIEGLMSTTTWSEFLRRPKTDAVLWVVLLDTDEDTNFSRLRQRRAVKLGVDPAEVYLSQETEDNLASKLRNFRNLYTKMSKIADYSTKIHTSALDEGETAELLTKGLANVILSEF